MNSLHPDRLEKKIQTMADIAPTSLSLLCSCARPFPLLKKQYILKEKQICNYIYFVESGCLRTFYDKDGKDINLHFSFENSFVTNLKSLRAETPSDYSIQAIENSFVWEFDKKQLLDLYKQSPEVESFGRKLLEVLLIEQEEHTNLFKLQSPTERYSYIEKHNPELLQRISLTQIASYLGIARETLSRIRKAKH